MPLIINTNRTYAAKAAWKSTDNLVIGDIEAVVSAAVKFPNGIEYIKELNETSMKFIRISKPEIERALSNNERQIELFNQLKRLY